MKQIKKNYKNLSIRWHPDTSTEDTKICEEMMQKVNLAYEIVLKYCENYEYSFEDKKVRMAEESDYGRWWQERFGDDPLWGGSKK